MLRNPVFQNILDAAAAVIKPAKFSLVMDRQSIAVFRIGGLNEEQRVRIVGPLGKLFIKQFKQKPVARSFRVSFPNAGEDDTAPFEYHAQWKVTVPPAIRMATDARLLTVELVHSSKLEREYVELWLTLD